MNETTERGGHLWEREADTGDDEMRVDVSERRQSLNGTVDGGTGELGTGLRATGHGPRATGHGARGISNR